MTYDNWITLRELSQLLEDTGRITLAYAKDDERSFQAGLNKLNEARQGLNLETLQWEKNTEITALLAEDWPTNRIPFGDWLAKSMPDEPQKRHMLYTLAAASILVTGDMSAIASVLKGKDEGKCANRLNGFIHELWLNAEESDKLYLPIAFRVFSLYHDIGKAIALERHPFEGYHLINDMLELDRPLFEKFQKWISAGGETTQNHVDLFSRLIRYHDLWGNIATGEASLALFSTAIELTEINPKRHLTVLSCLLLNNLSDTYAPFGFCKRSKKPLGILTDDVDRILERWSILTSIISTVGGSREPEKIWIDLVAYSQGQREAIKRIYYLLSKGGIETTEGHISLVLRSTCGGWFPTFCRAFGTVRLSYALKFVEKLKSRLQDKRQDDELAVKIWIEVLTRAIKTYETLISTYHSEGRVTGIEMASLTRNEEVATSIIDSLIKRSTGVLNWVDDEITAFPQA